MRRHDHRAERGAGSVLAVALLGAMIAFTLALVPLFAVLVERQRVAGAADAAALAAADVAVGRAPGIPCLTAHDLAVANATRLERCVVDGLIVTVRVTSRLGLVAVSVDATAGPPGAR